METSLKSFRLRNLLDMSQIVFALCLNLLVSTAAKVNTSPAGGGVIAAGAGGEGATLPGLLTTLTQDLM